VIDHIKLFVSDFERSKNFYVRALEPLGYRIVLEPADGVAGMGRDMPDFWIQAAEKTTTAHVAFRADNHLVVDAFYQAALASGGTDNGGPGLRPQYHSTYYGAFVLDFDGNNIEAVCHKELDDTGAP
jgi:catechol 2,3-dioxygenase-like lactoylglutathione lyase family enzyme